MLEALQALLLGHGALCAACWVGLRHACLQQVVRRPPLADNPRGGAAPPAAGSEAAEAAEDDREEEALGRDINRADFEPWKE